MRAVISTLLLVSTVVAAEAEPSFNHSKKRLAELYQANPYTFYCGCAIEWRGRQLQPDLAGCGYQARKNQQRAARVEWEHIVPAWAFGHQLQCWQDGGRRACRQDARFRQMEADMHNLVPAIGEVNGDRSNYRFAELPGEPRLYGRCDFEVDFKARKVEPAPAIRGDIARSWFYMRDRYGLKLSSAQTRLFDAWHRADPVDAWELQRNRWIESVQGNGNPHVLPPVQAAQ